VGAGDAKFDVFLYCNQLQLGNAEILYSDGKRYKPAAVVINKLKSFLPTVNNVLVLGTGLGSIVRIVRSKGYDPDFTLVEQDKEILKCAVEFLAEDCPARINPVCSDAQAYMQKNTAKYDLIFIDIFIGRVVPDFVTTPSFLALCRNSLSPGGRLAFNYIINEDAKWQTAQATFAATFPEHKVINDGINRLFITN
jgi:spermidine synthase